MLFVHLYGVLVMGIFVKHTATWMHTQICHNCMQGTGCVQFSADCTCPVYYSQCNGYSLNHSIVGVQGGGYSGPCQFYECGTFRENSGHNSSRLAQTSDCPYFRISTLPGVKSNCNLTQLNRNIAHDDICLESCLDTAGCRGVTFISSTGDCYMHDCKHHTDGSGETRYSNGSSLAFISDKTISVSEPESLIILHDLNEVLVIGSDSEGAYTYNGVGNFSLIIEGAILFQTYWSPIEVNSASISFVSNPFSLNYADVFDVTSITFKMTLMTAVLKFPGKEATKFVASYEDSNGEWARIQLYQRIYLSDIRKKNVTILNGNQLTITFPHELTFSSERIVSSSDEGQLQERGILNFTHSDVLFIKRNCDQETAMTLVTSNPSSQTMPMLSNQSIATTTSTDTSISSERVTTAHSSSTVGSSTSTKAAQSSSTVGSNTNSKTAPSSSTVDSNISTQMTSTSSQRVSTQRNVATAKIATTTEYVPKPIYIVPCQCSSGAFENKTMEQIVEELVANTSVYVRSTASRQRKHYSAQDSRPSAQCVGYVGMLLLALVFGVITVPDIIIFIKYIWRLLKG